MSKTKYPPIILVTAIILMFAYSCECPAQIELGPEVKPTKPPIAKPTPTPATPESWTGENRGKRHCPEVYHKEVSDQSRGCSSIPY